MLCEALFIQFIESQGPLHVSSITCLSSGGVPQTAFGIMLAYNVSWLWHSCSETAIVSLQLTLYSSNIPNAVCGAPPEDEQVMLETCKGPWFAINWMKSASRWFHYTDILWCTVTILIYCDARSLCWYTVMHGQQNIKYIMWSFTFENKMTKITPESLDLPYTNVFLSRYP
jgi:hypothetical protein